MMAFFWKFLSFFFLSFWTSMTFPKEVNPPRARFLSFYSGHSRYDILFFFWTSMTFPMVFFWTSMTFPKEVKPVTAGFLSFNSGYSR